MLLAVNDPLTPQPPADTEPSTVLMKLSCNDEAPRDEKVLLSELHFCQGVHCAPFPQE